MLECLLRLTPNEGEDAPFVWEQGDASPLKSYAVGNVVLVGDAAHSM